MLSEFLSGQGYLSFLGCIHTTLCLVAKLTGEIVLLPNSPGLWVLASSITAQFAAPSATATAWAGILVCTELHPMIWIKITLPKMGFGYLTWVVSQSLETR